MNATALLPRPDVLPLPAPVWLLHGLLLVTFLLHLVFMNGLLGGILLVAWSRLRARSGQELHGMLASKITPLLPIMVAAAVTFGVAPLLFLQALYGQFFFTSSVIMGWTWFAVIVILIGAYYGTYLQSLAAERLGAMRTPLLILTAMLLCLIAFIYTNNTTLMLRPDRWAVIYFANSGGGNWNLGDRTLWPRYLHMVLGAVAIAGMMLAVWGHVLTRSSEGPGRLLHRRGLSVFTWLTAVNIIAGLWFFLSLSRPVRKLMMGGSPYATALLGIGLTLTIVVLGLAARAKVNHSGRSLAAAAAVAALTLVDMILLRDQVRAGYLHGLYAPASFPVEVQVFNLVLFGALLSGGVVILAWMIRKLVARARPAKQS
jgi:hypothetical protein